MTIRDISQSKKVHQRRIEVTTYEYDQNSIVVEGALKDERFLNTYYISGEARPPGTVHEMVIQMKVKGPDLIIDDIDVDGRLRPADDGHAVPARHFEKGGKHAPEIAVTEPLYGIALRRQS